MPHKALAEALADAIGEGDVEDTKELSNQLCDVEELCRFHGKSFLLEVNSAVNSLTANELLSDSEAAAVLTLTTAFREAVQSGDRGQTIFLASSLAKRKLSLHLEIEAPEFDASPKAPPTPPPNWNPKFVPKVKEKPGVGEHIVGTGRIIFRESRKKTKNKPPVPVRPGKEVASQSPKPVGLRRSSSSQKLVVPAEAPRARRASVSGSSQPTLASKSQEDEAAASLRPFKF
eukprot:CAMPEP_0114547358 /NCGR_PEP_ID=MMETSP0114-20121206/4422_1 /TAXON_ID=31324 /ORGANISM="Goniomonas sp, Strain m" /LENGTH=230 /DNA_ID=CAMNT_0001731909 /DNA_START=6 /DNA_END=698 /DNA_ORIENTATION=+